MYVLIHNDKDQLVGLGVDPIELTQTNANFRPVSFPDTGAGIAAAIAAAGLPADTPRMVWNPAWDHIGEAHAAMSPDQVLILPERAEPYWIDSSNGFMADGVREIDGADEDGVKDGSRLPVVSRAGHWFEMTRARRGIIGLGPGAVVEPTNSGWSATAQPILERNPPDQRFQNRYMLDGSVLTMSGAQNTLIGYDHPNPVFANFTLKGRSFGGVAYSGIKPSGGTQVTNTFKRMLFDECWRSHAGVPNGETGCLTLNRGSYLIEHCDIITPKDSVSGGSCIMWNNNTGGVVRHVRADVTNLPSNLGGMWTFWKCGGLNVFENVHVHARQSGINIEQNLAGFELDWTGGTLAIDYPGANRHHFVGNPSGGPPKVTLRGVDVSPNGYVAGRMTFNNYHNYNDPPGQTVTAKRSWITCDTRPALCLPADKWID